MLTCAPLPPPPPPFCWRARLAASAAPRGAWGPLRFGEEEGGRLGGDGRSHLGSVDPRCALDSRLQQARNGLARLETPRQDGPPPLPAPLRYPLLAPRDLHPPRR